MNRKYRVWDKTKNRWINKDNEDYSLFLLDFDGKLRKADFPCGNGDNSADSIFDPIENQDNYIIQFFTGLTDKNGKDIYEGDILKFTISTPLGLRYEEEFKDWENNGKKPQIFYWQIKWLDINAMFNMGNWSWYDDKNNWEVVGNIFENPDLLTS